MKKIFMLAAILAIGTSIGAFGEEIASQKLKETVISTENFETSVLDTAKNVTIITQEDIQNKGANTVAEALKGVPGLVVRNIDGGTPKFDMRGSGATSGSNTLVLVDGIPLNNITGEGYSTDQIPVDQIEKIEIVPAGGVVMYGDGAIGGIINIITKTPQNKKYYGSIGGEISSWKTYKGDINYGTKISDKFLMDISYSKYQSEGFRDKAKDKYDKEDKKESIGVRGKYLLDDGYIEAKYRHSTFEDYYTGPLGKSDFDRDPSMAGSYNGIIDTTEDNYFLSYNKKMNDKLDFMIYGGYDEREPETGYTRTLVSQYYIKPQLKYNYGDKSYIIVGGDYKDGVSENKLYTGNEDKTREAYAGYILNKTIVGDFQFTQGYRREKVKYSGGNLQDYTNMTGTKAEKKTLNNDSYELAVNYLYSDTGSIYLNYVKGFRTPTLTEMGAWAGTYDAQETTTYELGIKDMKENTSISASIFLIDTDNEIYFKPISGISFGGRNTNFDGNVRRVGTQLSLMHYFDKLTLRENISYIQPKVTSGEHDGKEFAGVSRWQANIGTTYDITEKLMLNLDMYYLGKAYGEDDFNNKYGKVGGYTTFDMNIKYEVNEGLEVYTGIKNLFDKEYCNTVTTSGGYKLYYPADGRSFYAGFKYNF